MTDSALPLEVHVLSHTHWDREWYHPAGVFRARLIPLVDELLDDPGGTPFVLDGQAIILDDYLDVRPERRDALAAALHAGRLEAGPWFVLADELIPSGEALIRNLLAGRRTLAALGASPPPVLYSPDAFGHPAALPTLAYGFGCQLAIVWRGYGGSRHPMGDSARWRGIDGSEVILFHLPRDGYEYGSNLPPDERAATARWTRMLQELSARSTLGVLLVQNGADHHARQLRHADAIVALHDAAAPLPVHSVRLGEFAASLRARASRGALPMVRGELRDSYGYTWTLPGTLSSRAHQKRANARAERLLIREVEPWTALVRLAGHTTVAPAVRAAWRDLLACHPHDTLCGCSIDDVASAMDVRLSDVRAQGVALRDGALSTLSGHDASAAHSSANESHRVVLVRNSVARTRSGVVELTVDMPLAPAPVGPGSGVLDVTPRRVGATVLAGGSVAVQLLSRERVFARTESPRNYPRNELVERRSMLAWLSSAPGYAVRALDVGERSTRASVPTNADAAPALVQATREAMENEHLRVEVSADGGVRIINATSGWDSESVFAFEGLGDQGDLYTHSAIPGTSAIATCTGVRLVHRGPLRGEIETRWRLRLPQRRVADAADGARRVSRGDSVTLRARIQLDAGAPFVRLVVEGRNAARDQRTRVVFRTGLTGAEVVADAALGPVLREPIVPSPDEMTNETAPPTAPLHRYVTLFQKGRGCTIYSDGLAEYEARENGDCAITLVRAVGELSRRDLPERLGHAGWPAPAPLAQCLGSFVARFAIFPHGGPDAATLGRIERVADDVLIPLAGNTLGGVVAPLADGGGLELEGEGLGFSAAKESEDGTWILLRCVNVTATHVRGAWRLPRPLTLARLARLDETPGDALTPVGDLVYFDAPPRAVVSILVG